MKITIINVHSVLNKGDSGIVVAIIQMLKRLFPGCSITISSQDWQRDAAFYETHYGCKVISPLVGFPCKEKSLLWRMVSLCKELIRALLGKKELVAHLKNSSMILSCGGGFLFSYNRWLPEAGFVVHCAELLFATRHNKNVILCPQSIGPFASSLSSRLAKIAIRHARMIFAREPISYEIVRGMGLVNIDIAMDMGFSLVPTKADRCWAKSLLMGLPEKKAAVTVRKWHLNEHGASRYLDAVANAITSLTDKGFAVFVVPQVIGPGFMEDDRDISRELIERLRGKPLVCYLPVMEEATPTQLKAFYGFMDIVIGTRMHSTIFALSEGVPALSIAYQPKAVGVFSMISQADCCFPIENLGIDQVRAKIADALKRDIRIEGPRIDTLEAVLLQAAKYENGG